MGDIGDYWNDVKAHRKASGLPARRSVKPLAVKTTRKEAAAFREQGLNQRSEWHWQMRLDGDFLDYWPSTFKWRWRGETHRGQWGDLVAFIASAIEARSNVGLRS